MKPKIRLATRNPQGIRECAQRFGAMLVALELFLFLQGCASQVRFQSASPSKPVTLDGSLFRPEGPGPFPAVVLLPTCGGVRPHVFRWAQWLKNEGYLALVVDSLSPRGTSNVCKEGTNPTAHEVAWDAFGALAYLRSLPFVARDSIGVMGWSYGAMAALVASRASSSWAQPPGGGFQAAVPFYPSCGYFARDTAIPVLVLLGGADDWTPPSYCEYMAKELQQEGRPVSWKVYPGAHHGFDQAELPAAIQYLGHTLAHDAAATADAEKRVRAFLKQYLGREQR